LIFLLAFAALLIWWGCRANRALPARTVLPLSGWTIGIDPGHGGYDPGAKRGELLEKDVVLEISLYLREYLQQGGARVVMTRDKDIDLLETLAGPKKRLDLKNRLKIIEEAGVDLLISIHTNDIVSSRWRGAQVFYQEGKEDGKLLACAIQDELGRVLKNTARQAKGANYYMLRESSMTAVLVEAGFLSNPEEARLLAAPDYQKKVAWAIYLGIIKYLYR